MGVEVGRKMKAGSVEWGGYDELTLTELGDDGGSRVGIGECKVPL